jgi:GT2 family glycosyltransferase
MSLSLIIPYYNAASYLNLCLSSLEKEANMFDEIIIVSNGSNLPPDLPIFNGKTVPQIFHFENPLGYAAAINKGVEKSGSRFLLFCDADTFFPDAGWIAKHFELRKSHPNIGITSSKLINYRTNRILDFGIGRTRLNNFHPCRDALVSDLRVQNSRRVQMACSAVMMIEKELFSDVGGFDESLRYFYQDIDLCLRLKEKKREVWVVGDAIAYHRGSSTKIVRSPFQIDERAHYTVKNANLMEVDYPIYLNESLTPYLDRIKSAGKFGLVNLSTLIDLNEILDIISPLTDIKPLAAWTPPSRDVESLTLSDILETKVLRYGRPLLMIVDRFLSLRFNALWQSARDTSHDMVIDRHANVLQFDQITV